MPGMGILPICPGEGTLVIDKNLPESLYHSTISSVGGAPDYRAGGLVFDSRGRTNIKVPPLPAPDSDGHARKIAVPSPLIDELKKIVLN